MADLPEKKVYFTEDLGFEMDLPKKTVDEEKNGEESAGPGDGEYPNDQG